jgi:uncharacterized protein
MSEQLLVIRETAARIIAEPEHIALAVREISRLRNELESYIGGAPRFRHSLEPVDVAEDAPAIARRMAAAAAKLGVGPMAAVAGAIAGMALEAMQAAGAVHGVIDNGGDIALLAGRPLMVGIFTGPARLRDIALRFPADGRRRAVCTSSGTVGHSLSFGCADAALAVADDAALADAAATALGNAVPGRDADAIRRAMERLLIPGIDGLLVVVDDLLVIGGDLPPLVRCPVDSSRVAYA